VPFATRRIDGEAKPPADLGVGAAQRLDGETGVAGDKKQGKTNLLWGPAN
jgi:hypothetical protein